MTLFWILAAGLLTLVGWLVLPTLFGRTAAAELDRAELNRVLQRTELAELDAARARGELDAAGYQQARSDLERCVLDNAQHPDRPPTVNRPRRARATAFTLMIAVPTLAVLGYRLLGGGTAAIAQATVRESSAAAPGQGSPHAGLGASANMAPMDQLTERLAQRLQTTPDDANGWLLLARSYQHLGRQADAQAAYAQAQAHGAADAELAARIAAPAAITRANTGANTAANTGASTGAAPPSSATGTALDDLKTRTAATPDDGAAWLSLAQIYRNQRAFEAAGAAFAKAYALLPATADLLADYADALAAAQGRRLDGEPSALVDKALQLDPDHPKALWLAATAALQRDDTAQAKTHWLHLQRLLPDGSPDRHIIDRNLAALDDQSAGAPDTAAAAAAPAVVRGRVDISPAMRARVSADDTVFIFARAADGPPMPLAVLRKQVRDLPYEFRLDDSLAMQPQMTLSSFDQVMLGARVSRSGTVPPLSDRQSSPQSAQPSHEPRGDLGPVPTRGGGEQQLLIDSTGS